MAVVWKEAIESIVDQELQSHESYMILKNTQNELNDQDPKWDFLHEYHCKWGGVGKYTLYDAYAAMQIYHHKVIGAIGSFGIFAGVTPYSDNEVDKNQSILDNLPESWSGDFWGKNQDEDGVITSSESGFLIQYFEGSQHKALPTNWTNFPIEFGYQPLTKTWAWLVSMRRIAVFPYGSEVIYCHQLDKPYCMPKKGLPLPKWVLDL